MKPRVALKASLARAGLLMVPATSTTMNKIAGIKTGARITTRGNLVALEMNLSLVFLGDRRFYLSTINGQVDPVKENPAFFWCAVSLRAGAGAPKIKAVRPCRSLRKQASQSFPKLARRLHNGL